MNGKMKAATIYIAAGAVVLLIIFLSVSAPIVSTSAEFSVYNPGWDGCSSLARETYQRGTFTKNLELSNGKEMKVSQKELTSYDIKPITSSIVILGPGESFTSTEIQYIDDFLSSGGKVVVADDFKKGNSLLSGLNTSSRFVGEPLYDLSFSKRPEYSVAYNSREHPITENVSLIQLNRATGISPDKNATSLVNTSSVAWLDSNGNEKYDAGERRGNISLISVEEYGKGELLLVSDPSIFINSMQDELDNEKLTDNILGYISKGRSNIVFDESHREMSIIYQVVYTGRYPSEIVTSLVLLIGMTTALFLAVPAFKERLTSEVTRLPYILKKFLSDEEKEDLVSRVLKKHPEWNEDKLEMIHDRFIKNREEGSE